MSGYARTLVTRAQTRFTAATIVHGHAGDARAGGPPSRRDAPAERIVEHVVEHAPAPPAAAGPPPLLPRAELPGAQTRRDGAPRGDPRSAAAPAPAPGADRIAAPASPAPTRHREPGTASTAAPAGPPPDLVAAPTGLTADPDAEPAGPEPAAPEPVVLERTAVTFVEREIVAERDAPPPAPAAPADRRYVVRWDDAGAPLSGPLRARAERSIVERARDEVRRRIAADPAAAGAPIEIVVQNVTVRAEPPPAAAPPAPPSAPAADAFAGSLLRRTLSHGF